MQNFLAEHNGHEWCSAEVAVDEFKKNWSDDVSTKLANCLINTQITKLQVDNEKSSICMEVSFVEENIKKEYEKLIANHNKSLERIRSIKEEKLGKFKSRENEITARLASLKTLEKEFCVLIRTKSADQILNVKKEFQSKADVLIKSQVKFCQKIVTFAAADKRDLTRCIKEDVNQHTGLYVG